MRQTLRKAGGSLVMTIPKTFIEQNKLSEGSQVELVLSGKKLVIEATQKPKYRLADLLAEMPAELPQAEGWDTLPDVGEEQNK
ncbi:Growth regulator [Limnobacter sp. 130]|jgi:antitoxin ChpS|uniref:AbrB/MazE/SpoVT family DNA-binding domain-containing protein n=1 Tax=Limnobacter sp. 130 TaxID=2653147 RepID=UPI0012F2DA63|nr:AbrB/MazE/SpoVT family DNA-binding domain-containing protein [Limnobacter sp. 130]VWX32652.1 Growth regulator [Limnobacter sp. 130]